MGVGMNYLQSMLTNQEERFQGIFAGCALVAEETLTLIRTVMSFNTYAREIQRYDDQVTRVTRAVNREGIKMGLAFGLPDFVTFAVYALTFWYGARLVRKGDIEGQDIIIVLIELIMGAMGLGQCAGNWTSVTEGRMAAARLFSVIDRESEIDGLSEEGLKPKELAPNVTFEGVEFAYPSKPEQKVLRGLTFQAREGETVALVGESGCGKSTTVRLLERFYDPTAGRIAVGGHALPELNIQVLRKTIGLVTQTPILMPTTLYENIAAGKEGATKEDVVRAAKAANAHEFISGFKDGYQTNVGDLGSQLSGGQRQRIAIARVLINDPRILLLDEATSALDNASELVVQQTLDKASAGRTTIVIAHRLSTVRDAHRILVLDRGCVMEEGTHEELLALKGRYHDLWRTQQVEDAGGQARQVDVTASRDTEKQDEDEEEAKKEEEGDQSEPPEGIFKWVMKRAKPEWPLLFFSIIGALFTAILWPFFAIIYAEVIEVVLDPTHSSDAARDWALGFLGLAVINLIGQ
jgi:ABC-type multidrug transport system fused ATPase/permease subunit